jgi:hypothetical protein
VLTPLIADCNGSLAALTIDRQYRNPQSQLDYRHVNTLKLKQIPIVAIAVILGLWLVNWVQHIRICVPIHHFHTAILVAALITPILRLQELIALDSNDSIATLSPLREVMEIIEDSLLFSTLLLTAKGWCIVRDSLRKLEIVRSVFFSLALVTFTILLTSELHYGWRAYVSVALALISFIAFVVELMMSINRASLHIVAHLLVIANAGIAPQTTPVFQKHRVYERFEACVVLFAVLFSVRLVYSLLFGLEFWVDELISDWTKVGIYGSLAFLLRLRGSESGDYTSIGDASLHVPLTDLTNVGSGDLQRDGVIWEEGMDLPPRPVIVEKHSFVTIASPDGETEEMVFTEEERGTI